MSSNHSTTYALTPSNSPLMQPVSWQGQTYFTSQYFHAQYLANSPYGGKYRRHKHFARLLRSIDLYADYIALEHIVEVSWDRIKTEADPIRVQWIPLFQETGYQPLTLLDAKAQAELAHHLDDKASKQIAHAANSAIVQQASAVAGPTPLELATRDMAAWMEAARIFETPPHIAQQEGVKMIGAQRGVDFRPLLKAAPAQLTVAPEEMMLEPTDLGKRLNVGSGRAMNMLLEQLGWQTKVNDVWEMTPTGRPYGELHAWNSDYGTKSGYNLRWKVEATRQALKQAGLIP